MARLSRGTPWQRKAFLYYPSHLPYTSGTTEQPTEGKQPPTIPLICHIQVVPRNSLPVEGILDYTFHLPQSGCPKDHPSEGKHSSTTLFACHTQAVPWNNLPEETMLDYTRRLMSMEQSSEGKHSPTTPFACYTQAVPWNSLAKESLSLTPLPTSLRLHNAAFNFRSEKTRTSSLPGSISNLAQVGGNACVHSSMSG